MRDIPMRISHAVKTGIELISPKKWDNNQQITWAELEMLAMCGMFGWFPCLKIVFVTNKIWKIWCHCSHPGFQFHPSPRADWWRPFCDRYLYEPAFPNVASWWRQYYSPSWIDVRPRAPDPATFFHRYSTIPATRPCQVAGPGDDSYKNMPKLRKSIGFPRTWTA